MSRGALVPQGPALDAALGFLGPMGAAMLVAGAGRVGLLDASTVSRGLGLIVGVTVLLTGNLIPKLRPLAGERVRARAAERLAGWSLSLAGLVFIAAFLLRPLPVAKLAAAWAGLGALALIAGSWAGPLRAALRDRGPREARRWLPAFLLLALAYVLGAACLRFLGEGADAAWWLLLGYWLGFAVLGAVLGFEPRGSTEAQ